MDDLECAVVKKRGPLTHGHSANGVVTRTYSIWRFMKRRCLNPKDPHYARYGGRGISVCHRWHEFAGFLEDMGEAPAGLELDRINNDGHYEPSNCRWATRSEQMRNSSNAHWLTLNGETLLIGEWERKLGFSQGAISHRLRKGWSVERALTATRTRQWTPKNGLQRS